MFHHLRALWSEHAMQLILTLLITIWSRIESTTNPYRLRYAITENQPMNLRIGKLDTDLLQTTNVRNTDLINLLQTSRPGTLNYKLREPSEYFHLDSKTGVITTKQSMDSESLCPRYCQAGEKKAKMDLFINIWYEHKLITLVQVEISVVDVDDNAPRFPANLARPYVLRLKEVIYRAGQQIELPKAIDPDVHSDHAEIAYRLEVHPHDLANALDVFQLMSRNDSRLMLVLQRDLDYEKFKLYQFYLVAWSPKLNEIRTYSQSPAHTKMEDRLEICIEVLNINDIEPVFDRTEYLLEIPEDTKVGSIIYQMKATDQDENSTISYTLDGANADGPIEVQSGGFVILRQKLDYEEQTKYEFVVRASDGEFYALTRLRMTVTNVNDEPPVAVTNPVNLTVKENQPQQTLVGQLLITDSDSPAINGHVRCHEPDSLVDRQPLLFFAETESEPMLSPGIPMNTFDSLSGSDGAQIYPRFRLYTSSKYDRENEPHIHESLLICSDGWYGQSDDQSGSAQKRRTATLTISLTVTDENDNTPVFKMNHYETELEENCPIGTKVIQVHANDADSEPHATPRYSLLNHELFATYFDIEPETGWIVTSAAIDRETHGLYQLTVLAIDGKSDIPDSSHPSLSHTVSTHVQIRVLDENDNAPEFRGPRQFAVEENQPGPKCIGTLQAIDRDEGVNQKFEFKITPNVSGNSAEAGVFQLGRNFTVNDGDLPIVVSKNGTICTTGPMDREKKSHYCFEVTVRDLSPSKALSSMDTICVRVLDINDNKPYFTTIRGSVSAPTNNDTVHHPDLADLAWEMDSDLPIVPVSIHEMPGYCALIAIAKDQDEGRNALLHYSIKDYHGNATVPILLQSIDYIDAFMMDEQTGRLMLTRSLNQNEHGIYKLKLVVRDSGKPSYHDEKVVQLLIRDTPARGNWLLPEMKTTLHTNIVQSGEMPEFHTILIVIGLSGVSALLAIILITAILCMIKPCRKRNQGWHAVGPRGSKSTGRHGHIPGMNYSMGITPSNLVPPTKFGGSICDDYHLAMLDANGQIGAMTLDRTNARSVLLNSTPIPGLDQIYLPPDKVIGVDNSIASMSDGNEWSIGAVHPSILQRLSPNMQICQYSIDNDWINNSGATWNCSSIAECNSQCTGCHLMPTQVNNPAEYPFAPMGDCVSSIIPSTCPPNFEMNNLNAEVSTSNSDPHANGISHLQYSVAGPMRINSSERNTAGEEQRSDSGRGASDEEIPPAQILISDLISRAAQPNSDTKRARQMRSATLKTVPDSIGYTLPGIIFPSLPRMQSTKTRSVETPLLTTFNHGGLEHNKCSQFLAGNDSTQTSVQNTIVRLPKSSVQ